MRQIIILFCLLSFGVIAQQAPNFNLSDPALGSRLSDLKGKVVYLDFWASWCKPCRHSFTWMNQLQAAYGEQGLVILAINLDAEPELAQAFLQRHPASFHIQFDPQGNIAEQYQLLGMPSSYLIDAGGTLRHVHQGFFTDKQPVYHQQIKTLLGERYTEQLMTSMGTQK
ncbi:TlpA disulfide reductase family protein [Lacimicrobium alkaliphilum]|uniref:Thioredoxin domain-containing protein n=1 Tax=Lacimicrobium alkaliphilum TaxID=1526571 RepID=A0ABQ1RJE3_9ALTE|nr:TlpA disulfide reductase family protein [Lacimicrobium alkaliphilum]GGD68667.1 hypothetical protein GCM10011357_24680 [Lacimicrobium alkaliphilum]